MRCSHLSILHNTHGCNDMIMFLTIYILKPTLTSKKESKAANDDEW